MHTCYRDTVLEQCQSEKMPFVLLDIRSSLNAAAVERVLRISAETWWIMGSKRKL